jgi:hypothetical protein
MKLAPLTVASARVGRLGASQQKVAFDHRGHHPGVEDPLGRSLGVRDCELDSRDDGPVAYNREQWIESFEGQLSLLRPHLSGRVLTTMSLSAWLKYSSEDPIKAAKEFSKSLDQGAKRDRH